MNAKAQAYWDEFWQGKPAPIDLRAEQFGWDADLLAQLIIDGKKTATCSGHPFYQLEKEPIPQVGTYMVVLSSQDEPLCIIKTTAVDLIPFNEVPEEFAIAEGEGDLTYQFWYDGHKAFFQEACKEYGIPYADDMLLVCERFELVDVKR